MIITNAFSLNMVRGFPVTIDVEEISLNGVIEELFFDGIESAVDHADTAAVFTDVIGLLIPTNRCNVSLSSGDRIIVGQYIGPANIILNTTNLFGCRPDLYRDI